MVRHSAQVTAKNSTRVNFPEAGRAGTAVVVADDVGFIVGV
jgi:hypothetical protein